MEFVFQTTPLNEERLIPQISQALEKRTELISREKYPGLWNATDRFSAGKRPLAPS